MLPSYKAKRADDGTLTIFRVPIFVECKRGDSTFDADWLTKAFNKAKQAEREGYLPPLHVRHHDAGSLTGDPARPAGFFRLVSVEPITFKGARRLAVFADLTITDPMVGSDILAKRLPYRSVEIFDVDAPGIDSLALLDHEAPYLELPMLMVDEVEGVQAGPRLVANATFANPWLSKRARDDRNVVACFRRGRSAHLLIEDAEMTPEEEAKLQFEKDEKPKDGDKPKDGEKAKDGEKQEAGLDIKAVVKAIEDGSISVADMDAILAAIQKQRTASADTNDTTSAPASAAAPGGEAMTKKNDDPAAKEAFAKLSGENAALRARLDERDAAEKRKDDVAAALKRLAGRPLGSDLETKLVAFHKEHGPKAFQTHVDAIAQTFGALEGDAGAAERFRGAQSAAPESAAKFVDHGTEAVAKATKFAREWEDLNQRGLVRMSCDRYVQINMEREGVKLTKASA